MGATDGKELGFEEAVAQLGSGDLYERNCAAMRLGELGGAGAVEALLQALAQLKYGDEAELPLAEQIILALGRIGDARAVPALIPILQSGPADDLEIEETACLALSTLGGPEAVEALRAKFAAEECEIHGEVAEAILSLQHDAAGSFFVAQLTSSSADAAKVAASALGELAYEPALLPLQRALRHRDEGVRAAAAEALGEILNDEAKGLVLGVQRSG